MQEIRPLIRRLLYGLVLTMHSLCEVRAKFEYIAERTTTRVDTTVEVLYARIFSFDGVIDALTTGYAIVSGLYGMDCQNQLQHHMNGMLFNGATRQDLFDLRELCLGLANILGVKFRHGPAPIPSISEESV